MLLHVAVVHTPGDVCHLAAATSRQDLTHQLADYVRRHSTYQLWPDDARHVQTLVAQGRAEEAVSFYFDHVGKWDPERLVVQRLNVPAGTVGTGGATPQPQIDRHDTRQDPETKP